ncbi:MAG: hypothetical protein SFX73_25810 [Kofleriaceae bacterium]|nr:hypothetical protein [Kofleriaceae bacterium]
MKLSPSWIACGALATNGVFWASVVPLVQLANPTAIVTCAALVAGLVTGAMIAKHAAVRPWHEPLIAALLGLVGTLVLGARSSGYALSFAWWKWGVMIAAVSAGAVTGAMLVRQFARAESTPLSTIAASMVIHLGTLGVVILGFSRPGDGGGIEVLGIFVGTALGGFLTQLAIRRAHSATCACGPFAYVLLVFTPGSSVRELPAVLVGCLVMFLVAWIGSGVARRFVVGHAAPAELPTARLR